MSKIGKLKDIVPKEVYKNIRELLDIYAFNKFDYLCVSFASWEELFINLVCELKSKDVEPSMFSAELIKRLNLFVGNFISKKIKSGEIYICDKR